MLCWYVFRYVLEVQHVGDKYMYTTHVQQALLVLASIYNDTFKIIHNVYVLMSRHYMHARNLKRNQTMQAGPTKKKLYSWKYSFIS